MLYPEFAYRPPPPSYSASMQEYRLRLLLDRHSPLSPPPQYRTGLGTGSTTGSTAGPREGSRPPSYRCRLGPVGGPAVGVSVISVTGDGMSIAGDDPFKLSPEGLVPAVDDKPVVPGDGDDGDDKEGGPGNLVTVVTTPGADELVTVTSVTATPELDILARL